MSGGAVSKRMQFTKKEKFKYAQKTAFRIKDGWKPLFIVPVGIVFLYIIKGFEAMIQEMQLMLIYTVLPVTIWYILLFLWHYLTAPLVLQNEMLLKDRGLIHKMTDADLQRMLHGYIYDDTFHYEFEAMGPIKSFKGPDEFEKLRARYNIIKINCPANCKVYLNIELINTIEFIGKPLSFWIKDGAGKEHEFDYNETLESICFEVGRDSNVYIKLEYPSDVAIDENVSLQIKMDSWKI